MIKNQIKTVILLGLLTGILLGLGQFLGGTQGLTIGLDGKTLVPTLSAERATSAEESRIARGEIAQARLEFRSQKTHSKKKLPQQD